MTTLVGAAKPLAFKVFWISSKENPFRNAPPMSIRTPGLGACLALHVRPVAAGLAWSLWCSVS